MLVKAKKHVITVTDSHYVCRLKTNNRFVPLCTKCVREPHCVRIPKDVSAKAGLPIRQTASGPPGSLCHLVGAYLTNCNFVFQFFTTETQYQLRQPCLLAYFASSCGPVSPNLVLKTLLFNLTLYTRCIFLNSVL